MCCGPERTRRVPELQPFYRQIQELFLNPVNRARAYHQID